MPLALDFSVHLYSRANGPPCCGPGSSTPLDETISYREIVDVEVVAAFISGDGTNATTVFKSVEAPPSPYTGDVLSYATAPLLPYPSPPIIGRQYGVSVVSGLGTLEGGFLRVALRSVVDPITGQQNLYERGVSWGRFFPNENEVQVFTSESFEHYLETRMQRKLFRPLPDVAVTARLIIEALSFWAVHRHWDPRPQVVEETVARDTVVQFILHALGKEQRQ
jgi:hypothetical protein